MCCLSWISIVRAYVHSSAVLDILNEYTTLGYEEAKAKAVSVLQQAPPLSKPDNEDLVCETQF